MVFLWQTMTSAFSWQATTYGIWPWQKHVFACKQTLNSFSLISPLPSESRSTNAATTPVRLNSFRKRNSSFCISVKPNRWSEIKKKSVYMEECDRRQSVPSIQQTTSTKPSQYCSCHIHYTILTQITHQRASTERALKTSLTHSCFADVHFKNFVHDDVGNVAVLENHNVNDRILYSRIITVALAWQVWDTILEMILPSVARSRVVS